MEGLFKVWKVRYFKRGNLLGFATVLVADKLVVTGIRICEGKNGRFIGLPQRKVKGEYKDICYPWSKGTREQLQAEVLKAFDERAAEADKQ